MQKQLPKRWLWQRSEYATSILLTVLLIFFHLRFFFVGGPLWRDEISTLQVAVTGSLGDLWRNLHHDSFPIFWHCVLRLWHSAGPGQTDAGLRGLGLLVGTLILAATWWNARRFHALTPIVSLTLLGFANANLCYIDSMRAYGIGLLGGLLTIGAMWELSQDCTKRTVAVALISALLAVNSLYYDSVIVFAVCCGATAVGLINRRYRNVIFVISIGVVCAVSLACYRTVIHDRNVMSPVFQMSTTYARVWTKQRESVLSTPNDQVAGWIVPPDMIWALGLAAALLIAAVTLFRLRPVNGSMLARPPERRRRDLIVFSTVALMFGIPAYWTFLVVLKYIMQPWYFIALMGLVSSCLEGLFTAGLVGGRRMILVVCAAFIAALNYMTCEPCANVRMTNVDLTTNWLETHANSTDLIVVSPWWLGVSFGRYYHGAAPWTMLPSIPLFDFQRTDLYMTAVKDPLVALPIIEQVKTVLRQGHHVFLVGQGATWLSPPPAKVPSYPVGALDLPYLVYWEDQLWRAVYPYTQVEGPLLLDKAKLPTLYYERLGIYTASGWQDRSTPSTAPAGFQAGTP